MKTCPKCGCCDNYADDTGLYCGNGNCRNRLEYPRPKHESDAAKLQGFNQTLAARVAELEAALRALPLDAFSGEPADIDASEFIDHAESFMTAMDMARSALRAEVRDPHTPAGSA